MTGPGTTQPSSRSPLYRIGKGIASADADYVLRWLKQTKAPQNIIALQERVLKSIGDRR